ncbi:MAG: hypothetical protein AAB438_01250 [Patescibacteria group bacterium]
MKKQVFGAILFIYLILHTTVLSAQNQVSEKEAMFALFVTATSFQDFIDTLTIRDTLKSENSWTSSVIINGITFKKGGSIYDTYVRRCRIEVDGFTISWVPSFGRGCIWVPKDPGFCFTFFEKKEDFTGWRFFVNEETNEKLDDLSFDSLIEVIKKLKNFKK